MKPVIGQKNLAHDIISIGIYFFYKKIESKKIHYEISYSQFSAVSTFPVPYFILLSIITEKLALKMALKG